MLNVVVKKFSELTIEELYALLGLRSEVFVVEQDCVYQDIDGKDVKALHVLGFHNDTLAAYTRIFAPGDYFKLASIGRVVVSGTTRKFGFGKEIMNASINAVNENFKVNTIQLSAQTYLKRFYNDLDFVETGQEYLEDDIPHIAMILNQ